MEMCKKLPIFYICTSASLWLYLLLNQIVERFKHGMAEWMYTTAQRRDRSLHSAELIRNNKVNFHHSHSKYHVQSTQSTVGACVFIKGSLLSTSNGSIELFFHHSMCGFHYSIDLQVIAITRRAMHTNKDWWRDDCILMHARSQHLKRNCLANLIRSKILPQDCFFLFFVFFKYIKFSRGQDILTTSPTFEAPEGCLHHQQRNRM